MKKVINRKFVVFALALAMIITTAVSLVWWAATIQDPNDVERSVSLEVGTANDVVTAISTTDAATWRTTPAGPLVPVGELLNSAAPGTGANTAEIVFVIPVTWTRTSGPDVAIAERPEGELIVTHDAVTTAGTAADQNVFAHAGMFNVNIAIAGNGDIVYLGSAVNVTITITLLATNNTSLADSELYALIAGEDFWFWFTFSIDVD
jgi:hypothetical protein